MENVLSLTCASCGGVTRVEVEQGGEEKDVIQCAECGAPISTVGKTQDIVAQQEAGLGADELSDDHR